MIRGKRKLHHQASIKRQNRSELINKRNEKLIWRFIYHDRVKRRKYEDVLQILSEEFFISTITISDILTKSRLLDSLLKKLPSLAQIKENSYPFVVEISREEKQRFNGF